VIRRRFHSPALAALFGLLFCLTATASDRPPVHLVLQVTIDGLRADLIARYADRFGDGGFRYLLDKGVIFTNAHYRHANTETIVGHATLATGAHPSVHGMTGNVWLDHQSGELAYNIEDRNHPMLPTRAVEQKGDQVDPSQKVARTQGRSPNALLAPTLGDTLSAYTAGRAKVFGISGKDRSAVAMAGKTGKAFWFSTDNGDFVTSDYYYDAYPIWVRNWNTARQAASYAGKTWSLLHEKSNYLFAKRDNRPYEVDLKGYGRVFPHQFAEAGNKLLNTQILVSPIGDKLLLDFAKELIAAERIGEDAIPDYLSISFSGVDAVNHFFGPSSLENEDQVLQLDRTLADLFGHIDEVVGLDKTIIVLSADHGMADMPEYLMELGYKTGRLYPDEVVAAANKIGRELFALDNIAKRFFRPYLYLNDTVIAKAELSIDHVAVAVAGHLIDHEGIAVALPRPGLEGHGDREIHKQIARNYHPQRSGDIYVAQAPYWFSFEKGPVAAMHGSPWRYDTHVPIIFAGARIESARVSRLVHPVDVAPTLAALLNMTPPASSQGKILTEVRR